MEFLQSFQNYDSSDVRMCNIYGREAHMMVGTHHDYTSRKNGTVNDGVDLIPRGSKYFARQEPTV
jgi:hypothetical protein